MKLIFTGTSATDVTGTCNMVIFKNGKKILLDCGTYQSNSPTKDYAINNANFPFKAKEIDYVILSHIHQDHSGLLCKLYNRGYKGKVGIVSQSKLLLKDMLEDAHHVMSAQCEYLNKKKKTTPIFEIEDVERCISRCEEYDYYEKVQLDKDIYFQFIPAGHITRSAQIIIHEGNDKLVFSGDLGRNDIVKPYTEEFQPIRNCKVAIMESTYGVRQRESSQIGSDLAKLKEVINSTRGNVIIPVFALARCQELLTYLYELNVDRQVVIDSPLAKKITQRFSHMYRMDEILEWDKLKITNNYEDSLACIMDERKKIVLSSSGMQSAGRIVEWTKHMVNNPDNTFVYVGYAAEGTTARKIQDGAKTIKIVNEEFDVKCNVVSFHSFSSHMTRKCMLEYYSNMNCNVIILTHGSKQAKLELKEDLEKELYKKCKSTKVLISEKGMEVNI